MYRIKYNLNKLKIIINDFFRKSKYKKNICILSSSKYKNKVVEDINLKYYFNKRNIGVNIIDYNENVDFNKYDLVIIRSVWGFYREKEKFINLVKSLSGKVFNDESIIINNLDKEIQYKILEKNNIETIQTVFTNDLSNLKDIWNNNFKEYNKLVIKPTISESGNDTFCIDKNFKIPNIKTRWMVEPFIESVKDGEISVILFNGKVMYGVRRYSGIFCPYQKTKYIDLLELDNTLILICNKVSKIKEYSNHLYMRIDFVFEFDKYLLMEVELIDPLLFMECVPKKLKIYDKFVESVLEKTELLNIGRK